MPCDGYSPRFCWMVVLTVTASSPRQFPTIIFNLFNHVAYFQKRSSGHCGVGLAVADGVALLSGEAAGAACPAGVTGEPDGVAVPLAGGVAVPLAAGVSVALGFGCMFTADLSFTLASGPKTTWSALFA